MVPRATTGAARTGTSGYTPGWATIGRVAWVSRSQLAVLLVCQIPLKSGLPSAVRLGWGVCESGIATAVGCTARTPAATMMAVVITRTASLNRFRIALSFRDYTEI